MRLTERDSDSIVGGFCGTKFVIPSSQTGSSVKKEMGKCECRSGGERPVPMNTGTVKIVKLVKTP